MDPISTIKVHKDSSFAMLLAAQARGWQLFYMEQADLYLQDGRAFASMRRLSVRDQNTDWYEHSEAEKHPLSSLDVVLMRKDPPVNMEYLYTTHVLERAELEGVLVVNRPSSLRNCNEKLFTAWFPECCVFSVVSRDLGCLWAFLHQH